ncbi:GAS2-like protein 3 [Frankliniella fusca]|uniref:GAS2-like protein 3 n=1 Tax=Frankliniella fusca TaxID=407009 RepID=A0AAE1GVN5_9NEOP|nr:GAS2-like protein 3 [Frankliniella fusca]
MSLDTSVDSRPSSSASSRPSSSLLGDISIPQQSDAESRPDSPASFTSPSVNWNQAETIQVPVTLRHIAANQYFLLLLKCIHN